MTVRELIKSLKFVKRRIGNVEVFVAGCNHNGDFLKCSLSDSGIACNADSITITAPHHNANTETCVCCGAEIPEGRQVCPACEAKVREENNNGTYRAGNEVCHNAKN